MYRLRWMLFLALPLAPTLAQSLPSIVLASSSSLVGCAGDECANDCERNDWPRAIVGIDCDDGGPPVGMTAVYLPDGRESEGDRNGCPVQLDGSGYTCSVSFSTNPSVTSLELRAQRDGAEATTVVPMREFNYCGRDIAYVELSCAGGDISFGAPQYISPCSN